MGDDNNVLVVEHLRGDGIKPVGEHSIDSDLETFSARNGIVRKMSVLSREPRVSFIVYFQRRRRYIVATSPLEDLLFTVFSGSLGLVESLEGTVVSLIEAPVLVMRDPVQVQLIGDGVVSLDGALQHTSVSDIELEALLFQHLAGFDCLLNSLFRERDVVPTCEAVLSVPSGLSVSHEDNLVHFASTTHGDEM